MENSIKGIQIHMALRVCCKYNSVLYSYLGWEIDKLSSTPSPHTPSFAPTDHSYTLSLYLLGRSVGEPEGVGGKWCRAPQSATLCRSRAQNYTCGKPAVPYSYALYTVFHSVIFNSVVRVIVNRLQHNLYISSFGQLRNDGT